jgi:hypothetical protein
MRIQSAIVMGLAAGLVVSCGGGGGDGGSGGGGEVATASSPHITTLTGNVSPPSSPPAAAAVESVASTPPISMLLMPDAPYAKFPAITQTMNYTFDPAEPILLKVSALDFFYTLDTGAFVGPVIGPTAFATDAWLGIPTGVNILTIGGASLAPGASTLSNDTVGGLPAFVFNQIAPGGTALEIGYAMPHSFMANQSGFTYQTFGYWVVQPTDLPVVEGYFSTGVPADVSNVPVTGSAFYTGIVNASFVDVTTREPFDVIATVTGTVNFDARTVAISTTGTRVQSNNSDPGTPYTSKAALNVHGTLTYAAGSNTYTGIVSTADGMTGNATGRFYGAGFTSPTTTKAAGSPMEIGGTFAVMLEGVGAMQGAFGGQ